MSLGMLIVLFLLWLVVVFLMHRYRVWILYYVIGTVGFIYWLVFFIGDRLDGRIYLAQSVAYAVHWVANGIGIPTHVFEGAPGVLLVMVVVQKVGWTVLQVGVESSGLLEIGVLVSLLLFFPGWTWTKKLSSIALGSAAIWVANIIRMCVIVIMLNRLGKEMLVLAHTYIGKALFFGMAIMIFWYLITQASLDDIQRRRIEELG